MSARLLKVIQRHLNRTVRLYRSGQEFKPGTKVVVASLTLLMQDVKARFYEASGTLADTVLGQTGETVMRCILDAGATELIPGDVVIDDKVRTWTVMSAHKFDETGHQELKVLLSERA